jgi:hypothetical protein
MKPSTLATDKAIKQAQWYPRFHLTTFSSWSSFLSPCFPEIQRVNVFFFLNDFLKYGFPIVNGHKLAYPVNFFKAYGPNWAFSQVLKTCFGIASLGFGVHGGRWFRSWLKLQVFHYLDIDQSGLIKPHELFRWDGGWQLD